ncbi:hypothetical protein L6R53_21410 [Myxococcota bacterium]|nr:hypothetical protein [Myxococcota bacterium]
MPRRALGTLALVVLAFTFGGLAHLAQRDLDPLRRSDLATSRTRVMPDPAAVRAAAMGQPTALADLLWVRVTLNFADLVDTRDRDGLPWLSAMLDSVLALDPAWRTPFFYGGSMMRVLDDVDASDRVFQQACQAFPLDPYFPFSLGMNAFLYRKDPATAAAQLTRAAELPGAPAWYRAAAAGFLDEHGQRQAALEYLRLQLEDEEEPAVRAALEDKYKRVLHDELAATLDERKAAWEAQAGQALDDLDALQPLPEDPLGEGWVLAPDGKVRSAVAERREAEKARDEERAMLITGRR